MQTFLPYDSFTESARVLDVRRLGKQRVETKQILMCLLGEGSTRWGNHPAVKMWRGYELDLATYGTFICEEWTRRGYRDTCLEYFTSRFIELSLDARYARGMPPWIGNADFHASHRSNLLRKDPAHYGRFGWAEPDDLPYVWPASE